MAKRSVVFSLFLVLIFFPAIAEIVTAQTLHDQHKLCEAKSQTYSKLLCKSKLCDRRCISWEKAVHGACHPHFGIDSCYCYFECSQTPSKGKVPPSFGKLPGTPPPAAPPAPPPGAGGLLPPILPPIGGGSPPPPPAPPTPPPGGGGRSPSPPLSPPAGGLLPPLLPPIGDGSKPCKRTKAYV